MDSARSVKPVLERIVRPVDFERVLARPPRARSTHFAAHHLPERPCAPSARPAKPAADELSTAHAPSCPPAVDDLAPAAPHGHWLGLVVPKRHARRAVTRTLLKRQIRVAMAARAAGLAPGLWVLRLKAGFDREQFRSASSEALRGAVRAELALLFDRAAAPPAPARPRAR